MAGEGGTPTPHSAQSVRRRRISIAVVLAFLMVGAAGSFALLVTVSRIEQRSAARLLDQKADNIRISMTEKADSYSQTLADLATSVGAQSSFTADDFGTVTSQLNRERLPGASGVAFVVPATAATIPAVQAYWRRHGSAELRFDPTGVRSEHMFTVFSHGLDGTVPVIGRDISGVSQPREALELARATGQVAASRTYVLLRDRGLPDSEQQLSFTLTAPVYGGRGTADQGQFRGWVLMGMRGRDFVNETLAASASAGVWTTLTDPSGGGPDTMVASTNGVRPMLGELEETRSVTVGQRTWSVRVQPTAALLSTTDRYVPMVAGGIGLLLTVLIAFLANGRRRALSKVDEATAALRLDIEHRKTVEARLRQRENELRHLAMHDPLTGLVNRTLFNERLQHAMVTHSRTTKSLAVLFIDLDGFKGINDELGHGAGDAVLIETASRLRECARDSDTVARLGGDEFAILAELLTAPEDIEIIADRVVRAMQVPFGIEGRLAAISCSVGVAVDRQDGQSADDLLRRADTAMYAAKAAGKDRYAWATAVS